MDNFYIDLEKSQLTGALQGYKDTVNKIPQNEVKNYSGLMGIKNSTRHIHEDGSWSGRLYNNVVRYWNDVTSTKLYSEIDAYYKSTIGTLQNITDIYSGLDMGVNGTDLGGNVQVSDEIYSGLNEKLPTTDEMEVTFVLVNIDLFRSTVEHIGDSITTNAINAVDAYLDEHFKGKSTTLDLYVQKIKEKNVLLNARIKEIVQEYHEVIQKNINVLKQMENMSMKDVNEKL